MARRSAALATLLRQVNSLHPARDTASDGWLGDTRHQAIPSDHNPAPPDGIVRAQDFDADGPAGFDLADWLWSALLDSRDPRISYVISRGQMFSSYPARGYPAWTPRPYSGVNKHVLHTHVSTEPSGDYDGSTWRLAPPGAPAPDPEDDLDMAPDELRALIRIELRKVLREEFGGLDGPLRLVIRKDMLDQGNRVERADNAVLQARLDKLDAKLDRLVSALGTEG